MNIKLFLSSLLLTVTIITPNQSEKIAQLDELTEAIIAQDKKVSGILDQLKICINLLKGQIRKSGKNITEKEFDEFYLGEVNRFAMHFIDNSKDKEQLLFDDSILGEDSALLKFYIVTYSNEMQLLKRLLHLWAILKNELSDDQVIKSEFKVC